jgi:hypothetical protein
MNRVIFLFAVLSLQISVAANKEGKIPQAAIRNEQIKAVVYLPDKDKGYYRSSRFDWAGVMPELLIGRHNYFGQWNESDDPLLHDAIMGPVEEFAPLGYDDVKAGSTFVKIGVGKLRKPDESRYNKFTYYPVADNGSWKVTKKSGRIIFNHVLEDDNYGYLYEKELSLPEGNSVMVLSHSLVNRGKVPIVTTVYNHNFFVIDTTTIGPYYSVTFPFKIMVDETRVGDNVVINGNRINFRRDLKKGETINLGSITGFSDKAEDYDIRIENSRTGAGVRITCDRPISRIIFWGMPKTLSPEPYINISIDPGEKFTWKIIYEFYQTAITRSGH